MFKKILKGILVGAAGIVALTYAFGYDYLFRGIRQTYLRGETGSTINDEKYFDSNVIAKGNSVPWQKDSLYNIKQLPKTLVKDLKDTNSASFLVIKNGKLVHEEYWDGKNENSRTNSFSVAKGVTVMLLGKAIEENKIESENQKFSDFFGSYSNIEFAKNLTLKELASMEAGLDWQEDYQNPFLPNAKAYYGRSLEEAVFLRKFKNEPGKKFEYQSGATQMLGFALRKSLHRTLADYASEKFWKPLGMEENASWSTDDSGMEKAFCCIHSTSRDFAKLGQLFLNDGKFQEMQILEKSFVEKMRTPTKLSNGVYGMGLWVNNDVAIKHYYFQGLYGQYIIIVPDKQMVIVRTGTNKNQERDSKGRPKQVSFLVEEVSKLF